LHGDCSIRLNGLGFSAEEIGDCAQRSGLLSIELDLQSSHECRCEACAKSPRAILSTAEISELLRQAIGEGARRCIFVNGEASAHPELRTLIEIAGGLRMEIELIANASAIDADLALFLYQSRVSTIAEFNDSVEGAIGYLNNAGYGSSESPTLATAISVSVQNLSNIPDVWRWARKRGIEPYIQIIRPRDGEIPLQLVHPDRARSLFEELARIDHDEFNRSWPTPPALTGRSCKRHQFACHVTPCGTIFACVGVTIPLGNIRSESLHEILEPSEVLENLRAFGKKVKEPCGTCCKTTDCYGCRGAAYQLTGDYLSGDQLCWKANGVKVESLPVSAVGLVPHGKSMRVIDEMIEVGERTSKSIFYVAADSVFVDDSGRLDELAFIEMIAQSFAATHGFHLSESERRTMRGLLLGVKSFVVSGEAKVGDRLTIDLRKITRFGSFGVVEASIYRQDGVLLAVGQVKIWRPEEGAE
jgi:MoaA/NifB/PqqE/SkfB family radical SAM enzyme/predicted hotdog family 3-hydroxylacyl-ACP dehydratase